MRISFPPLRRGQTVVRVNARRFAIAGRVIVPAMKKNTRSNMILRPTRGWIRMDPNPKHQVTRYFITRYAYPGFEFF